MGRVGMRPGAGRDVKELTHTFVRDKCVYLHLEDAHAHICLWKMCLPAPEGAHAHICQRQMCLPAPEGAHAKVFNKTKNYFN